MDTGNLECMDGLGWGEGGGAFSSHTFQFIISLLAVGLWKLEVPSARLISAVYIATDR